MADKKGHGYLTPKKQTLKDLDAAGDTSDKTENPVDRMQKEIDRANENSKGFTDYLRNIFDD